MASTARMGAIEVSPEMLTLWGAGEADTLRWPSRSVCFIIDDQLCARFHARPTQAILNRDVGTKRIILLVDRDACLRLFSSELPFADGATYVIPADVRAIALAIRDCSRPPAVAQPYRLAKSIELLCELLRAYSMGEMVRMSARILSFADCQRIAAARRMIDESWREPLTLSQIARSCGLNRNKLSRGFRALFDCTVSEALTDRRLSEARRQLVSTDLPVGLIGYQIGYQSNASFSRAFCRRFGLPPSDFRTKAVAA